MLKRPLLAAAAALSFAGLAGAEEPPPPGVTRALRTSLGASLNPAGLQHALDVSVSRPLFSSHSLLLKDAHLAAGASSRLTPAYLRLGPWVELSPLSVLDVRMGVDGIGYFGTFHSLQPFDGYGAPFDDDTRRELDVAETGLAARAYVAPALKARAGRLTFVGRAEFEWWTADAPGPFFYEPFRDTLLRVSSDALVATETMLLWSLRTHEGRELMAGPVHELTEVYDAPANRRQLLGLLVVWGLGPRRLGFAKPVLVLKAARYMEHPNREGGITLQLGLATVLSER